MPNFTTIEIDFEVFQLIQLERKSFEDSNNDAVRRLLKLNDRNVAPSPKIPQPTTSEGIELRYGVFLQNGTDMRMLSKGLHHQGVVKGGKIWVNGNEFTSPSDAAHAITGTSVNGWVYWEVKFPGASQWVPLNVLRSAKKAGS